MEPDAALIRLKGVHFAYEGRGPVLTGVDLELRPRDKIGLLGSNGSGKSTLLHLMVGLLKPTAGEIEAFGQARRSEKDFVEVRSRAAITFQDPDDQLFCPTVAEDVAFGPLNLGRTKAEALDIVASVLAQLGLDGFGRRLTYRLSFGEKKLVALATVLAMQPDVLLLDEPFAGLDEEHTARLTRILKDLPQAMIVVSHERAFMKDITARRVLLADGRIQPATA